MSKYYKIPVIILSYDRIDALYQTYMIREDLIAKKTIGGYREVLTNFKIPKMSFLENGHMDFDTYMIKLKCSEVDFMKQVKVYFLMDTLYERDIKLADVPEVKNYLKDFNKSVFKEYYDKYKNGNRKQDTNKIKTLIKDFKKK